MKVKRKLLKRVRARGCVCVSTDPDEICGACLASLLLDKPKPPRRPGFVSSFMKEAKRAMNESVQSLPNGCLPGSVPPG